MNVRDSAVGGIEQHLVDEAHDGRVVGTGRIESFVGFIGLGLHGQNTAAEILQTAAQGCAEALQAAFGATGLAQRFDDRLELVRLDQHRLDD